MMSAMPLEPLFVDRTSELEGFDTMLRSLSLGLRRHIALIRLRRIGKTMLLDEIRHRHASSAITYLALDDVDIVTTGDRTEDHNGLRMLSFIRNWLAVFLGILNPGRDSLLNSSRVRPASPRMLASVPNLSVLPLCRITIVPLCPSLALNHSAFCQLFGA